MDAVADAGVGILALTDHDTTAGHARARARCAERGVTFVPGVEMTSYALGRVIHVLGLGVHDGDAGLGRACSVATQNFARNQRRWVEALASDGADISWPRDFAAGAVRLPVLLERLCARGFEGGDPQLAHKTFTAYFRALPPSAYAELPTPRAAADVIHASGGIAVLAHPYRISEGREWLSLLDGMDAIEAMYAAYDERARNELLAIADEHRLLVSCGSDYHGYFQGKYVNPNFTVSPSLLERLA